MVRMMGMPPPTLASKPMSTPASATARMISGPHSARSALFAVTTDFPFRIASSRKSFAAPVPPISSTTIWTFGSRATCIPSPMSIPSGSLTPRSRFVSLSATRTSFRGTPTRLRNCSAFSSRSLTVPVPTVPKPMTPTPISFSGWVISLSRGPASGASP